ncbi:caspase family protein [Mesorhizobium sp. M0814]|uniref:caspase family protein n=1 Tax=Mesorhizobium sp. M0814 TaxID=2957004 RepID=UPI003339D637
MATTKLTLEELNRKLADPKLSEKELEQYFVVNEEKSGPFNPVLELNSATVQVPATAEGRARSAALLNSANFISRLRRQTQFHNRIGSGTYKGPVIVSEGDSWFQYPLRLLDVIDHLMKDYAIFSLDAAGDTLDNMLKQAEYMDAIEETGATIFLFSGGGNDVVAGGNLAAHLIDFDPALSPEAHLRPSFDTLLNDAIGAYSKLVRQVAQAFPHIHILCHGYDYTVPAKGQWLGKPMEKRGIVRRDFQQAIARVMIDRFNGRLASLQHSAARLHYIDCRGTVTNKQWFDELHPIDEGYGKVAARFSKVINSLVPQPKDAPVQARTARAGRARAVAGANEGGLKARSRATPMSAKAAEGPAGMSLHIGLNSVDPAHYGGWDGLLTACEFDAGDMADIAKSLGYRTTTLMTDQATRKAVIDEIRKTAKELKAGDIFFLSYSGHGGQVPDFNGDEEDATDETWCLFDGQLIDDELYQLWSEFSAGVRVLVLSDSCHSGSVVRMMQAEGLLAEDGAPTTPAATPRVMPVAVASRTFRQNREFYRELGSSLTNVESSIVSREMTSPVTSSVRLISGCQDNQLSLDGIGNGAFTSALIATWDHGRFKRNYEAFHRAIQMKMPPTQTPNHWTIGATNAVFNAQTPFAI